MKNVLTLYLWHLAPALGMALSLLGGAPPAAADIEIFPFEPRPGLPMAGLPDFDPRSGRFVTVANGLRSLGDVPANGREISINLQIPGKIPGTDLPLPDFALSIFDGDLQIWQNITPSGAAYVCSGMRTWDAAQPICWPLDQMEFQLYADPYALGSIEPADLLYTWDTSTMPDDAWCALNPDFNSSSPPDPNTNPVCVTGARIPNDAGALDARPPGVNTGSYFYHLVGRWKTRNFPVNPVTGANGEANNFKVAVEGFPTLRPGNTIGFIGFGPFDESNDPNPGNIFFGLYPPTTFNGTFTFNVFVDTPTSVLELWDGDMDVYVPLCANVGGNYDPSNCPSSTSSSQWAADISLNPSLSDTNDFNSPPFPPFATGAFTQPQATRPGSGPQDGTTRLGLFFPPPYTPYIGGPPFTTVTSPDGAWTVSNDNPSGEQEWELFRIGLTGDPVPPNPLDQSDVTVDTIPAGLYKWQIHDLDGRNLVFIHNNYNNRFGPESCDLAIYKTCEVQAPAPEPFDCSEAKPIDVLTMIWRGTDTVWVKAWKGAIGTTACTTATQTNCSLNNGQPKKVIPGQEVTFDDYAGAPNDVFWEIFSNASGQPDARVGVSTFHISCSDADMNSADDCGKLQGNGKTTTSTYINTWQLEAMAGDNGVTLACGSSDQNQANTNCDAVRGPNPSCATSGKPRTLTFRYTGGACASSNNPQNGKFQCGGTVDGTIEATLKSMDGHTVTPATVTPGGVFTVTSSADMKADSAFELTNSGGKQTLKIHTSCSQRLEGGDVFGGLTLMGINGDQRDPTVTYRYTVVNTSSSATATNVLVWDTSLGTIGSDISLAPGQSWTTSKQLVIPGAGPVEITNMATASGDFDTTPPSSCTAEAASIINVQDEPPPACDIQGAAQLKIKENGKKVEWELVDKGGDANTIDSISISWPQGLKKLKKVKLDKKVIFEGDRSVYTSTTLTGSDWKGKEKDRTIKAGKRAKLKFEFEAGASGVNQSGFGIIKVNFTNGCSVTFTPGSGDTGDFECAKPISALTMMWDGDVEPVTVTAWKGAVGSESLGTYTVSKGEKVTVTGYAGAPNDVFWQIADANTGELLDPGLSTFHISCSDRDMNSADDCGKAQGNGKRDSAGYNNQWLFAGMKGQGGELICP